MFITAISLVILGFIVLISLAIVAYVTFRGKLDHLNAKIDDAHRDCATVLRHCESIADTQVEYHIIIVEHLKGIRAMLEKVPTFYDETGRQVDSITFAQSKSDRTITVVGADTITSKDSER